MAKRTSIIASSRRKRQKKYHIPYLPKEIIFNILSWLPAEFLHNHGRYVCKDWANILRDPKFLSAHLLRTSAGLFVQHSTFPYLVQFLEVKGGTCKVTDRKHKFPGLILCSSGGISLFFKMGAVYLANIMTMQLMKLSFPSEIGAFYTWHSIIAYIYQSGEYKVTCPCLDMNGIVHWYVLTVGSGMSWRKIDITVHETVSQLYGNRKPISAAGVLYYTNSRWRFDGNIFAIDIRDETTSYFRVPYEFCYGSCWLLVMGNNLCFVVREQREKVIKVCILKDLHQNEWAEVYRLKYNFIGRNTIWKRYVRPIAWLDNHQILIFVVYKGFPLSDVFIAYNMKTRKWRTIKDIDAYHHKIEVYTNSPVTF